MGIAALGLANVSYSADGNYAEATLARFQVTGGLPLRTTTAPTEVAMAVDETRVPNTMNQHTFKSW